MDVGSNSEIVMRIEVNGEVDFSITVSYTHLDVYKRQPLHMLNSTRTPMTLACLPSGESA